MRFLSSPTTLRRTARLSFVACATIALAAAAQADNIRYVSTTGSNANDCTLVAPCRTLQKGINETPTSGELRILASGDYGVSADIDKGMTISGNGHTVVLGSPIRIDIARRTSRKVTLRALVLKRVGSTESGIHIIAAAAVHIERCLVQGFTFYGIWQDHANAELFVIDSIVRDNGSYGLYVNGIDTTAQVTVDNARFESNAENGLFVLGSINAVVTRTVAAGNGLSGIVATSARMTVARTTAAHNVVGGYAVGGGGQMTLESSAGHGNSYGLFVVGGSTARISNSVFVNNTDGVRNNSGTVLTRGNNTVSGNTTNVSGTLTPLGGI